MAKAQLGASEVAFGAITDDLGDHRPGQRAADEHGVLAPLTDAGLSKADIRSLSWELGLETWDKPSFACLASRIPYGTQVTVAGDENEVFNLDAGQHADLMTAGNFTIESNHAGLAGGEVGGL